MKYPGLLQLASLAIVAVMIPLAERLVGSALGVAAALGMALAALLLAHLGGGKPAETEKTKGADGNVVLPDMPGLWGKP